MNDVFVYNKFPTQRLEFANLTMKNVSKIVKTM